MFDTLLNSYASQATFGDQASGREVVLDEYEKSVFLTKAQEELVTSYYSGRNSNLHSFEKTEEVRRYLSSLIRTAELEPVQNTQNYSLISPEAQVFSLPDDVWFITYESATLAANDNSCLSGKTIDVVPVKKYKKQRHKRNQIRGPIEISAFLLDIELN